MEYYNVIQYLVFVITVSLCSVTSAPFKIEKPCSREVLRLLKESIKGNVSIEQPLPQCDQQGYYKALQRTRDNFLCSTNLGSPIDHTRYSVSGPCAQLKECVKDHEASGARYHKLRCDEFGYFKPTQRTESGKICVRYYGKIIKRNVVRTRDCDSYAMFAI